jgi:A/G-specific adenine glycosylase
MSGLSPTTKRETKINQLASSLLHWFAQNARDLPWRRTRDPYAIWVSEIMLQQTQVKTVIPYWERWMRELPDIPALARAKPDKIHKLWEGLGYYTRVRNLQKAAQRILANSKSGRSRDAEAQIKIKAETPHVVAYEFPEKIEEVLALPGIGRYTAGAICSIAFNQPTPILDGNVIRVLTRVFGIAENPKQKETNAKLWQLAAELVSLAKAQSRKKKNAPLCASAPLREDNACSHLNQSLMELGALICTPRNAQCLICPVKKLCVAFQENRVDALPNLGQREPATARRFVAFAIEHAGKFLVRQRPAGVVNAHLWEFPNAEVGLKASAPKEVFAELGFVQPGGANGFELKPLCTVKHSITRYRITLEAYLVSLHRRPTGAHGRWLAPAEFDSIAFASAHKKLATAAGQSMLSGR